jgi:hypothetical protein
MILGSREVSRVPDQHNSTMGSHAAAVLDQPQVVLFLIR